jgi:SET domain-containing protein
MLLVPVILKPSEIHGLGVFCVRDLRAGMCVWIFRDPPDYRIKRVDLAPRMYDHAVHFGYEPRGKDYFEIPGDQAMFMNHSGTPNLRVEPNGDMVVVSDIPAGTELTCNYFQLEKDPEVGGPLKG